MKLPAQQQLFKNTAITTKTKKRVSFSNRQDTIIYTYNSEDYDRSPFANCTSSQDLHQIRNDILLEAASYQQSHTIQYPPTTTAQAPPTVQYTSTKKHYKFHLPSLKINTNMLGKKGPLFFTALSTNYTKFDQH